MNSLFLTDLNTSYTNHNSIVAVKGGFNTHHFRLDLYDDYGIKLPANLICAAPKRQADFLVGRYLAKLALSQLSIKDQDIRIGKNREPLWPNGVIGSISHASPHAICMLANEDAVNYLGVDIENLIPTRLINEIQTNIVTAQEMLLFDEDVFSRQTAFTLIFSAKESLFKALFPQVKHFFDFLDARVISADPQRSQLSLSLCRVLSQAYKANDSFTAYYEVRKNYVITAIY